MPTAQTTECKFATTPGLRFVAWLSLGWLGLGLNLGCVPSGSTDDERRLENLWGEQGISVGELQKPRAVAIGPKGNLYLVDMTARIQVYDPQGEYLRGWKTPLSANGRPSGLSFDPAGRLLVADTHYYRVLKYTTDGTPIEAETLGGTRGEAPGEFGFVTDAVEDAEGNLYVGEYGTNDRIQKFSPDGEFLLQWGGHGEELGQFRRPQNLAIETLADGTERIWAVDACNHRVQAFDTQGKLLVHWGTEGSAPGQLYFPYDLALDGQGHIYLCEYGNNRVSKFSLAGEFIDSWGSHGRQPGQLHNPWAFALAADGSLFVLDSNNHRVQQVRF